MRTGLADVSRAWKCARRSSGAFGASASSTGAGSDDATGGGSTGVGAGAGEVATGGGGAGIGVSGFVDAQVMATRADSAASPSPAARSLSKECVLNLRLFSELASLLEATLHVGHERVHVVLEGGTHDVATGEELVGVARVVAHRCGE